jgi:hypothetical protein
MIAIFVARYAVSVRQPAHVTEDPPPRQARHCSMDGQDAQNLFLSVRSFVHMPGASAGLVLLRRRPFAYLPELTGTKESKQTTLSRHVCPWGRVIAHFHLPFPNKNTRQSLWLRHVAHSERGVPGQVRKPASIRGRRDLRIAALGWVCRQAKDPCFGS